MSDDPFALTDDVPPEPPRGHAPVPAGPPPWLEGLNPEQMQAVTTTEGPLLVLSGAGTGKTRVLTTRLVHILGMRLAPPWRTLAVTFTNRAAKEMRERVAAMVGPAAEQVWLGTFHALCVRILRKHGDRIGLRQGFTILDTDDQQRVVKALMEERSIDVKKWPVNVVLGVMQRWKDRAWTPDEVPPGEVGDLANGKALELYRAYQARLMELNACDFGDLLLHVIVLFKQHPDVLEGYQEQFLYILVDEYQDTNVAQYLWLRLLARKHKNICCVGDDDQCLAAGTPIQMADGGFKPIEAVRVGDAVLSAQGGGVFGPAVVDRVARRDAPAEMVSIELDDGTVLTSTPDHRHFAGYRLGNAPQLHFTYLMYKRGVGYRLGTTQTYTRGRMRPAMGFELRCRQEHADALWLLSTHDSENDARYQEAALSLEFGIPTLPFVARRGGSENGLVHDQDRLDRLFRERRTDQAGPLVLERFGLSEAHPHYRPQGHSGRRRNLTITLCGERRGTAPLHRISIIGSAPEDAECLRGLGLSVRPVKKQNPGWRFETALADMAAVRDIADRVRAAFDGDLALVQYGRFGAGVAAAAAGDDDGDVALATRPLARSRSSLPVVPAASVRPGMSMFRADGSLATVRQVTRTPGRGSVYDLDVARTHNFVADGIVTHNSIYSWRGAEVGNILKFESDFPGAGVVRLERNYRSTPTILGAASALIRNNAGRLGKDLRAALAEHPGEKVSVYGVWDGAAEARWVIERMQSLQDRGQSLASMAVLVRAGFQTREFEERLITTGTPYRVVGGLRFYERQEIRDVLAYLRLIEQPADDLGFERIVNLPKRGLGDVAMQTIHRAARAMGQPLFAAARAVLDTDELKPKPRQALADFVAMIDEFAVLRSGMGPSELCADLLDRSGYREMWKQDKKPDSPGRVENLDELVRALDEFDSLTEFLEHVSLVMENDARAGSGDAVTLMTLHAAKGLEFDTVFLPGWEEEVFPNRRALDEGGQKSLEEERRLAYVGLTRARQRVFITHASQRRIFRDWVQCVPSRFIAEIPDEHKEQDSEVGMMAAGQGFSESWSTWRGDWGSSGGGAGGGGGSPGGTGWAKRKQQFFEREGLGWQVEKREQKTADGFARGARVFHEKFGYGTVTEVDGGKVGVAFDKAGHKKVIANFLKSADAV